MNDWLNKYGNTLVALLTGAIVGAGLATVLLLILFLAAPPPSQPVQSIIPDLSGPPPTPTSTPTPAPPPTATRVPTIEEVLAAFRAAGLEAENVEPFAATDLDGVVSAVKFETPSLCDGCSNLLFIFETAAAAGDAEAFFGTICKNNEFLCFHVYRRGRLLIRLSDLIPEPDAQQYERVLNSL